jgi:hypothetical protein
MCIRRFRLQGPRIAYVDNIQAAKNLVPAALPDLGAGLPPQDNGMRDDGMKQDLFHMVSRWTDKMPTDPDLQLATRKCPDIPRLHNWLQPNQS